MSPGGPGSGLPPPGACGTADPWSTTCIGVSGRGKAAHAPQGSLLSSVSCEHHDISSLDVTSDLRT